MCVSSREPSISCTATQGVTRSTRTTNRHMDGLHRPAPSETAGAHDVADRFRSGPPRVPAAPRQPGVPPMMLRVDCSSEADRASITADGEIDLATVDKLRSAITNAMQDGAHHITLEPRQGQLHRLPGPRHAHRRAQAPRGLRRHADSPVLTGPRAAPAHHHRSPQGADGDQPRRGPGRGRSHPGHAGLSLAVRRGDVRRRGPPRLPPAPALPRRPTTRSCRAPTAVGRTRPWGAPATSGRWPR